MFSNETCRTCSHVLKRKAMVQVGDEWFCQEHKPKYDVVKKRPYMNPEYFLLVECNSVGQPKMYEDRVVASATYKDLDKQYNALYNNAHSRIRELNAEIQRLTAVPKRKPVKKASK